MAHILIIVRVLVGVVHHEANGGTGRFAFKHTAEQFHPVGFAALCGKLALPGTPAVELLLYVVHIYVDARRETVYHTAHRLAVTLSECGKPQYVSECVAHVCVM